MASLTVSRYITVVEIKSEWKAYASALSLLTAAQLLKMQTKEASVEDYCGIKKIGLDSSSLFA